MSKRILTVILVAVLVLTLAGCKADPLEKPLKNAWVSIRRPSGIIDVRHMQFDSEAAIENYLLAPLNMTFAIDETCDSGHIFVILTYNKEFIVLQNAEGKTLAACD